tara:strand:- start:215 stop:472 length:258 start_codon:yes stop_codon:yes gene_type:complete
MPRKSKPAINPKDNKIFKELATGAGVKVTREQLISKIIIYRQEIFRMRSDWLKKMSDDCFPTEQRLKRLEHKFIAEFGAEDFHQI